MIQNSYSAKNLTGNKSEIVLPDCDNESNLSDKFA